MELFIPIINLARASGILCLPGKLGNLLTEIMAKIPKFAVKALPETAPLVEHFSYYVNQLAAVLKKGTDELVEWLDEVVKGMREMVEEGIFRSKLARELSMELDDAPRLIKDYEALIKDYKYEHCYYWKEGKGPLKTITSNLEGRIVFTKEQLSKLRGAILTHNHPLGSSLSPADIKLFLKHGLKEIRAVGKDGTVFSLKQKKHLKQRDVDDLIKDAKEYIETEFTKGRGITDAITLKRLEADQLIRLLSDKVDYIVFKTAQTQ